MEDRRRWALIGATLSLAGIATVADIASAYEVPAELYPFAGIVIGAALARIGGSKEAAGANHRHSDD